MTDSSPSTVPALPPGLAELNSISRDEFLNQMQRHPLFMQSLDSTTDEDNLELEAIKALAYEGTPQEIAINFKEQGNEAFREKRYRDALEFYSKGIAAKSGDVELDATLYLNRAASNLELGILLAFGICVDHVENYGNVLKDCARVLRQDSKNVKALYRSARACFALDKIEEAEDAISLALEVDPSNKTFQKLKVDITKRKDIVEARKIQEERKLQRKRDEERALKAALKVLRTKSSLLMQTREIRIVATPRPPDLGPIPSYHLSDPIDPTSDLIFPAILLYPLTSQTDLIAEFLLSLTLGEQLESVLEQPPNWDVQGEYKTDNVECVMEIEKEGGGRGLIKVGKTLTLEKVLKGRVVHDGIVRIFVLPKSKLSAWISEWKKNNTQES